MKGKESQNLFMSRKCVQLYLKIIVTVIIIVFAIHVINSHTTNPDIVQRLINYSISDFHELSTIQSGSDISNSNFQEVSTIRSSISNSSFKTGELSRHVKGTSFVLALSYYEQLTCATRNLFTLFKVAQNFDARVVIPFLWDSLFHGIPHDVVYDPTVNTHYYFLDTVYNMHKLNETFHSLSGTYFATFKELIKTAPRGTVVVDTQRSPGEVTNGITYTTDAGIKIFNCKGYLFQHIMKETHAITSELKKFTNYFSTEEFMVKEYICISPSVDTTTDEILNFIGPDPHTVIFTQWRGCSYHSCDIKASRSFSNHFRYRILYHSMDENHKLRFMNLQLPYDDSIKINARRFLENIKVSTSYISVHIRTEKLAQTNAEVSGYTDCCLRLLDGLLKSLKHAYPNVNKTVTVTDVGEYGSTACRDKTCLKHARKVHSMLTSMGLALVSFDPKLTGSSRNSAYVSLVEMNILAMGDVLVVVGKGSFKYRIISQFLESNPLGKVYHICTEHGNRLHDMTSLDKKCL